MQQRRDRRFPWLATWSWVVAFWLVLCCGQLTALADEKTSAAEPQVSPPRAAATETPVQRGYRLLTTKTYLPPDFDQEVFDQLWQAWDEPLRSAAAEATPEQRRRMAFSRYGLTESPQLDGLPSPSGRTAMQYVDDGKGGWVMNCLACHGGKVAGRVIPGVPNSLYALQTLTEDVRITKTRMKKPLSHMDTGSIFVPLGGSHGTTNAVMFGKLLLAYRDADLNVHKEYPAPKMVHHDHDAPAWWHIKRKRYLYIDGFTPKGHRPLMQFLLVPQNGPNKFREWEGDYSDVLAWIESLEPPKYPWKIDAELAKQGEVHFQENCAKCHGTYGKNPTYPEKIVPIAEVGTDRVRLDALDVAGRAHYGVSWFNEYGKEPTIDDPGGYVAPPLDGIWASAPYLHNGSVPTLWHLMHPDARPKVWKRTEDGYDQEKVGLETSQFERMPRGISDRAEKRRYFDTSISGKSAVGHLFPDELSEPEKRAVLEYLKTL
jgi:mono/diheme cytochrome c family protein